VVSTLRSNEMPWGVLCVFPIFTDIFVP
jgi:hypothetical protein